MDWATTHAGPQAIALCQHPELHMARHDDFMTIDDNGTRLPGRFCYFLLNRRPPSDCLLKKRRDEWALPHGSVGNRVT